MGGKKIWRLLKFLEGNPENTNSKNRYYKNRDALGKVLNYMYRTGGDTENDGISRAAGEDMA